MSRTVYTRNDYHLGDNLIFLHLLRALAKSRVSTPFVHFCHAHLIPQLREVVEDLPNILMEPFESPLWAEHEHEAINAWKNHEEFWTTHSSRWDWSAFTLAHHAWTAARMGFESPFSCREHLLFDYPALDAVHNRGISISALQNDPARFLLGDSAPSSGQYSEWSDHSKSPMGVLSEALHGHSVRLTSTLQSFGRTITKIGLISVQCKHHIMVANGPFWATMNTYNHHHHAGRRRIVLLDNGENLNMPFVEQVSRIEDVMSIARKEGWI